MQWDDSYVVNVKHWLLYERLYSINIKKRSEKRTSHHPFVQLNAHCKTLLIFILHLGYRFWPITFYRFSLIAKPLAIFTIINISIYFHFYYLYSPYNNGFTFVKRSTWGTIISAISSTALTSSISAPFAKVTTSFWIWSNLYSRKQICKVKETAPLRISEAQLKFEGFIYFRFISTAATMLPFFWKSLTVDLHFL